MFRTILRNRRRKVAAVVVTLGILGGAGGAFAYVLYHGSGSAALPDASKVGALQSFSVGLTISGGLDSGAETLAPGGAPYNATPEPSDLSQGVYIQNTTANAASVDLASTTWTVTSDAPGCPAGSFMFQPQNYVIASGGPLAAANLYQTGPYSTIQPAPVILAANSTIAVDGLESWVDTGTDQSPCIGSHLTLTVTVP